MTLALQSNSLFSIPAVPSVNEMPTLLPAYTPQKTVQTDKEAVEETLENFLKNIRVFDISRSYYAFTTKQFQKAVSWEDFNIFVRKYSVFFKNKHATLENLTFDGDLANYKGLIVAVDGENYSIDITFLKAEDEWKIHAISLNDLHTRKKN